MGVHVKVVQELLGHSDITITLNIYSHVLPSLQQDAIEKVSDLFQHPGIGGKTFGSDEQACTN